MKCGLCGYEFNPENAPSSCKSCSIMKGCKLIRCPNCGFEMPPEPRLPRWLTHAVGQAKWIRYFKGKRCPHGKPIPEGECCRKSKVSIGKAISPLAGLKPKQKGHVAYIHTKDDKKLQKLMAMGVLPGMTISLIQNFPSYVFQIGQSQFAIDEELAECIFVRFF